MDILLSILLAILGFIFVYISVASDESDKEV